MTDRSEPSPQVFLSHVREDTSAAALIARAIRTVLPVAVREAPEAPGRLGTTLADAVASTDMVVFLLSKAVGDVTPASSSMELLAFDAKQRGLDLVPVLLEPCEIPANLKHHTPVDLTEDGALGISRLMTRIRGQATIDFRRLKPPQFEDLVLMLLKDEFGNLDQPTGAKDHGHDAVMTQGDKTWLVQVKHYSRGRISVRDISDMLARIQGHTATEAYALLVTNAQVTSEAEAFLHGTDPGRAERVRIMDGSAVEEMLLGHPDLIERYFGDVDRDAS